jgi:plasmid maintenance system antidote protein VapI
MKSRRKRIDKGVHNRHNKVCRVRKKKIVNAATFITAAPTAIRLDQLFDRGQSEWISTVNLLRVDRQRNTTQIIIMDRDRLTDVLLSTVSACGEKK